MVAVKEADSRWRSSRSPSTRVTLRDRKVTDVAGAQRKRGRGRAGWVFSV